VAGVIDAWLRTDITLRASVIHERLAGEHWVHPLVPAGEGVKERSSRLTETPPSCYEYLAHMQ
jgi:hypothetical protein